MKDKKIAVFIGTRPEAIKMAPVVRALQETNGLEPIVVSTGQHREMLGQVVDLFQIPIHYNLDVMMPSQGLAGLSARIITRVDALLESIKPDFALVQGDTTTVLMAALACYYNKVPIGHVEAGLRTGNMLSPFPEEANRKLVSPLAALHFAPTKWAANNLSREGVPDNLIKITGNTVVDALLIESKAQEDGAVQRQLGAYFSKALGFDWRSEPFVLITGHRRENFGKGFEQICEALSVLADRFNNARFVYPVHLNPSVKCVVEQRLANRPNIFLLEPLPYRPFVALMKYAGLILTDSGGVQEEAPSFGTPVLVMRETTERPEGIEAGVAHLVGANCSSIVKAASEYIENIRLTETHRLKINPYGDGHSGELVVKLISDHLGLPR
jgi:UDP-N-acetylglucosamine 2-epimerase (non-hydrolysing)